MNSVTGKFKIGDEVIILKAKYAESCLQPGDLGIVKEVDVDGYSVAKKSDPAQVCFKRESFIDFGEEVDKLMWDDYRYCNGDTLEEMERECQVHNDCLTDLRARLEK